MAEVKEEEKKQEQSSRPKKGDANKEADIIQSATERYEESQDGSDFNRNRYEEDISFGRLGEQWPIEVKRQRELESRPCLTINKIPPFIRQVVNDARQNKPGIIVSPVDNGADVATAEVINGLVRAVQRNSNADIAFDTALDHAVSGGFGFFVLVSTTQALSLLTLRREYTEYLIPCLFIGMLIQQSLMLVIGTMVS